ncbi:hypothetical protein AX17_001769 [Amanita inopinata Kibby_2008]|nr:hypothetical protein AX17_001769 [Amanita inopinata Kibby_2008]
MSSASESESAVAVPETKMAPAPFDDPKADLILRTVDNVDFYVHQAILRLSSPVFASMLSLPQSPPQKAEDAETASQPVPVVDISEDSKVLYYLLSWVDPRGAMEIKLFDLEDIANLLIRAEKYDMEAVKNRLLTFVYLGRDNWRQIPVALFALGWRFQHKKLADFAAKVSLLSPIRARRDVLLLELINGRDHQSLILYYFHCVGVAKGIMESWEKWVGSENYAWKRHPSVPDGPSHSCGFKYYKARAYADWWIEYVEAVTEALHHKPSIEVVSTIDVMSAASSAVNCAACKLRYLSDIESFIKLLTRKLDDGLPK